MAKCEHGLTSAVCLVCASPKYGKDAAPAPDAAERVLMGRFKGLKRWFSVDETEKRIPACEYAYFRFDGPAAPAPCIGNDPYCPCQDGDACHYRDTRKTKAWPLPPSPSNG